MTNSVFVFRTGKINHLWENEVQQTCLIQKIEPNGRHRAHYDLVQLVCDPLL